MVEVVGDIVEPSQLIVPTPTLANQPVGRNGSMFMSDSFVCYISGGTVYQIAGGLEL